MRFHNYLANRKHHNGKLKLIPPEHCFKLDYKSHGKSITDKCLPYKMKQEAFRCGHNIMKTVHSHDHKVCEILAIMYAKQADLQLEVQ